MSQPLRDAERRLNRDEAHRRLRLWNERIATEQRDLEVVKMRMDAIRAFVEEYRELEHRERAMSTAIANAAGRVSILARSLERDTETTRDAPLDAPPDAPPPVVPASTT